MNQKPQKPGILGLIACGNEAAAATVLRLAADTGLTPVQLRASLLAAATGAVKAGEAGKNPATFEKLARVSAWRLPAAARRGLAWDMITALNSPDGVAIEALEMRARGTAVLVEERLLRGADLIDLAEAVADCLAMPIERAKRKAVEDALTGAIYRNLPCDAHRIYEAVFELAQHPTGSPDCVLNVVLSAYANRHRNGTLQLDDTVAERVHLALGISAKPRQSRKAEKDGDTDLPNPMAGREKKAASGRALTPLVCRHPARIRV